MSDALLEIEDLTKRFGGVTATNRLSLDVREGEIHALIGPNGAGKTTLVAQIMGDLRPDSGQIRLRGRSLETLNAAARLRLGLARTFQVVQLLSDSTALENVAQAVRARHGHGFRFWRNIESDVASMEEAKGFLAQISLDDRGHIPASDLAHGEQKQLELAIALATQPDVLLLDEPLAGLGLAESGRMIEILRALKGRVSMLLIEHDMDAVYSLADRISVLVNGGLIASGSVQQVRNSPDVRLAYLGEEIA